MNPILIGIVALGVAVLGLVIHAWHLISTRSVSLAALWPVAPLVGAMIAFLMAPQSLLTISLGGASLALAFMTLAATLVVPVLLEGSTPESAESRRAEEDQTT